MKKIFRDAPLDGAWLDGNSIVFCAKTNEWAEPPNLRACFAVEWASGVYRAMPNDLVAPKHPMPVKTSSLAATSIGGAFTSSLKGGLRVPHGATLELVDTKTKAKKTAPIDYDEHVVLEGWLGDGVVLHTSVDEGPGCVRSIYLPMKTWPIVLYPGGIDLGSCYDTQELVFDTPSKKKALVDGDGGKLVLVDPPTLVVDTLDPKHSTGGPGEFSTFTPSATEVVILYAAPVGDFVRYDLDKEAIASDGAPDLCDEPDAGSK